MYSNSNHPTDEQQPAGSGHKERSRPHFDEIYEQYWQELYEVAFRRLATAQDAEDILQDVFLSLLKNPAVLQKEGSIRAWLHRALKGKIIDCYRRSLVQEAFVANTEVTTVRYTPHPDDQLMKKELEALLETEISKMPEKMKTVFLLSRKKMLTNEEIARELALSDQTVRNQISAAIKRIRVALHQYNLAEAKSSQAILILTAVLLRHQ
jgi:RNA polymerase sigma-70 factor (family 1)